MSKNNNNEYDGASNNMNESHDDRINSVNVLVGEIDTLTSNTITNGLGESIVLNTNDIELKTEGTTKVTVGTNTTLTNNLVLPTTGSITNGGDESILFSSSSIKLKTDNSDR